MATKNTQTVELLPIELETVSITIVGTTPLIVHAWSEKAKRMMLDKQTGKATKAKHEVKVPVNDFMNSLYWLTEKPEDGKTDEDAEHNFNAAIESGAKFGFPVSGIKQSAIVGAGRGGLDVKMTELRGAFFIKGATDASTMDVAEIVGAAPTMREDMVKVGGNGDPSHPAFTHKIVYDYRTLTQIFQQAGFDVELLEWCDENGCFHYKYWNEADGRIGRSLRFDTRNKDGTLGMVSIILDAKKTGCKKEYFTMCRGT